ncbi:MAG: hypothetical protein Q8873_01150 [Bacillota bacterium]|nr:hypothetical protein [Bacillota bacterium]
MRYVILDPRADKKIIYGLEKAGFKVIEADFINDIDPSVAGHPDMQILKVGEEIIVNPGSEKHYKKAFSGVNFICGKTRVQGKYPKYIAYNVAMTASAAIHNFKFTDFEIIRAMGGKYTQINVHQGYSKCSVCTLPDGIITSDKGIATAVEKTGIDVLRISEGEITLFGKEYGFIGGASGYFDGKLYFTGDVTMHSDFEKIKNFCKNKCIEIVCLSNDKLADIGSIIVI